MARKYDLISALSEDTAKRIARNREEWTSYLTTAARLYKYPFQEQVLIYAQRPDASACASIELWNDTMHCWVNRGAKGIALIDENSYTGLKYVFDVSDVHKARRIGRDPNLWVLEEEQQEAVIRQLEKTYGEAEQGGSFEERLIGIAERIAEDSYSELASDIKYVKEGSFLEELDEQNAELRVRETLASSIAYTLLSRCGIDTENYLEELNFDYIHDFSTLETLSVIGGATTDLSKSVLMEIGKTIKAYDREMSGQERESKLENFSQKGLANRTDIDYNALKRESEWQTETISDGQKEGEKEHEPDIRKERGLSDTTADDGQTAGGRIREVRENESGISEGTQERNLRRDAPEGEVKEPSAHDSGTGRGEDGLAHQPDAESRGREREAESGKSDALGTENEQHSAFSGGNRADGTDLQLNTEEPQPDRKNLSGISLSEPEPESHVVPGEESGQTEKEPQFQQLSLFPSLEEQAGNLAAAEAGMRHIMPPAFSVPEERIDAILRTGGGRDDSRKRIFAKYQQGKTSEEMAELLRKEYRITGKGFTFDGQPVSAWFDENGMKIGYGTSAKEQPLLSMDWAEIEKCVRTMVEQGTYMSSAEAFLVDESERSRIANHVYFFFRDGMGELPEELSLKAANFPDSHAALINMLSTTEGIDTIAGCMDKAFEQLESGEKKLRFRSVMPPNELREELENLKADYKEFPLSHQLEVLQEDFITQDEIDARIGAGSGIKHGNFRIYEYFMEGHSPKENADFLKNEYGTGGATPALIGSDHSNDWHDSKGIRLEKGSIMNPYAKVLLSWNVVEKRIRELVKSDRYLSAEGKEAYAAYKQEQAEKALQREQERLEHGVRRECKEAIENIIAERFDGMRLPADTAEEIIQQYGQERVEYVLARSIMQFANDGRFSRENKEWAKELVPYADWNTNDLAVTSHPAVLDGFTNQARRYGELAREQEVEAEKTILETEEPDNTDRKELKTGEPKADKIEQKERLKEMEMAVLLCGACGLKDAAGWNGEKGSLTLTNADRVLEGKAACDYLLTEAADQVLQSTLSGDMAHVAEVDRLIHVFQPFADRHQEKPEKNREKQISEPEQKPESDTARFRVEQTSDAFEEPFAIWDSGKEDYHDVDGIIQTFSDEHEAGQYLQQISDETQNDELLPDRIPEPQRQKLPQIDKSGVFDERSEEPENKSIPASPDVKNYSYTVVEGKVYYRENSMMKPVSLSDTMEQRVRGMVGIRECTQELISFQLEEYPESMIKNKQTELNQLYDDFSKKYGLINSRTNKRAFSEDSSYCLLCSLEKLDDEGNFQGKADMFSKRTIKKQEIVTSVDTASEALVVSLSEKAKVDVPFMAELAGKTEEEITKELTGIIFKNPVTEKWENADEYLSGNVREKLQTARTFAENHPEYAVNVSSLEQVQPKELDASEIEVRIGATWIEPKYIEDFMRDTFETPEYLFDRKLMGIQYSGVTGQWNVKGKNADRGNALVNMTFGTGRANAYKILEDSLNLKDTRIFDTEIEDGKEKRILNKKETMLASQKQEAIREAFKDWVFREPERRETLCKKYNELFNSTRPREYDGSHLQLPGMTPDIILKPHQKNAVAHVLYGDNTLLAHCVGAGKTYEMTAAAMESKRLGLCQKSLFVVPNHLTEQWAGDFLRLYPGANILAATKKDFEPANRKKFCSRIATGDYDAVIIGHSQFEKIPLSKERQIAIVERQIAEIEMAIESAKAEKGERYTVKQMEKTKKSLTARLERLNDDSRKDDVVTFEQLGVDRLFVDESHNYKNLFLYTKMRNVAGIAQTEAQKSSDMFAKCQYLDELTGGKGITFATGTPISNSMTELYTNMRYLQYNTLQRLGLGNFDSWAATFGETQTAIELAPEGTGYRAKTRFAKFFNLPELIALFKESADIQTPDMLKLPVPEAEYINEVLKPSDYQKDIVSSLAERAEKVRDRLVEPNIDNMLKITNDGRKLALDQRLINDMLPDEENSKAAMCVENAFQIWAETKEQKSSQLIFCDLSTPKGDGTFNVYEDIRGKLMEKGVPESEIAFIHEANTETRKAELFAKVRSGQVRFLLGSTQKMGAGTNVQDRLIALHHLDVPWRPSDIEQQEGRILRQGNQNKKVKIFRYVTEGTFDSYSWQLIENKQKFIGQIMTSKSPVRSCEDIDEAALTYAEVKALATGNPYIKEKMDLDIQVSKLKLLKANHTSQKYRLEDNIAKHYPQQITAMKERIAGYQEDIQTYLQNKPFDKDSFSMTIGNKVYTDKKEAGTAFIAMCREAKQPGRAVTIGEYQGFKMAAVFDSFFSKFTVSLKGKLSHEVEVGADTLGNIQRLNNALESMTGKAADVEQKLTNVEHQLETAKIEVTKSFPQEQELNEKLERLSELNALLNMDEKGNSAAVMEDDEPENERTERGHEPERESSLQSQEPDSVEENHFQEREAEPVNSTGQAGAVIYPIENARHNPAVESGNPDKLVLRVSMTGREGNRISVKEKLAQMRIKSQMKQPEVTGQNKNKEKVESL